MAIINTMNEVEPLADNSYCHINGKYIKLL